MADIASVKTALISVSDKTGLELLARALVGHGVKLLSTGGTANALRKMGLGVTDVSDVTGFPEILDGRVKTLHPSVHGALLAIRGNAEHERARTENAIGLIDLLIVNLYPFEEALAKGASRDDMIENIDVGGPAMIRGASKNHQDVTVVVDPADYDAVLAELAVHKGTTLALRRKLAAKAFARTASYDAAISRWMADDVGESFPAFFAVGGKLQQSLRYGENPHQKAAAYAVQDGRIGVLSATQIQGKELSYNNINDADAALDAISEFDGANQAACVIVKHANPCGVAVGASLHEAYAKALSCDGVSAFGGILAFNRKLDGKTAEELAKLFTEVIIAPGADEDAKLILAAKKNLRLLLLPDMPDPTASGLFGKSIAGGLLVQSRDSITLDEASLRIVSKRKPSDAELRDLRFAWNVAKHVKSNAIVFARDGMTTGIGAGQMSRIDSTRIAVSKSLDAARAAGGTEPWAKGSVLASDAFFPFADGIEAAAQAGATAIIQPGGAMRDEDVIKCADDHGLAMVFTGIRHFRH